MNRSHSLYLRAKQIYRRNVDDAKKAANMTKRAISNNPCRAVWQLVNQVYKQTIPLKCQSSPDYFNQFLLDEEHKIVAEVIGCHNPLNLVFTTVPDFTSARSGLPGCRTMPMGRQAVGVTVVTSITLRNSHWHRGGTYVSKESIRLSHTRASVTLTMGCKIRQRDPNFVRDRLRSYRDEVQGGLLAGRLSTLL
ncbi:hypothetical protein J6590_001199 [Homalodisca vitripennis]|nr:hypothetical protein J6590_001199 [Homalodisca vitripennis]